MKTLAPLFLSSLLLACAPERAERYHTAETQDEAISLLNERAWDKVIFLLEKRASESKDTQWLLGQAHLGRAGVEPLALAAVVTEGDPTSPKGRTLFPKCPKGRIDKFASKDWKCILKRVYVVAPSADHPDLQKAKEYFRKAYPDASQAPTWVNSLIGLTETLSLVGRAGDLYRYSTGDLPNNKLQGGPADLPWLKNQGRLAIDEGTNTIERVKYSGDKVSKLLTGSKGYDWFEKAEGTVSFAKALGLPKFLDFVRENLLKPRDEILYGETIDKLREIITDQEKAPLVEDIP